MPAVCRNRCLDLPLYGAAATTAPSLKSRWTAQDRLHTTAQLYRPNAEKSEKSNKLKARLPRGLADRTPGEIAATRAMIEKIRAVYELYGFEPVETPAIEYTDALGKFLPDQDRPNEGVFSFLDDDEQWLSLRYDLTAPLARYVAENFDTLPKPYRSLSRRLCVPQREAGPGPLPPIHAVRCRHGRLVLARRRRRNVHDGGGRDGGAWHSARQLCREGEQSKSARRRDGSDWPRRRTACETRLTVLRAIDKLDRLGDNGVQSTTDDGTKGSKAAISQKAPDLVGTDHADNLSVLTSDFVSRQDSYTR